MSKFRGAEIFHWRKNPPLDSGKQYVSSKGLSVFSVDRLGFLKISSCQKIVFHLLVDSRLPHKWTKKPPLADLSRF
jgi:hypothetical protein